MENGILSDMDLLNQARYIRKKLRETPEIFDWKQLLIPQLTLAAALAFSAFTIYRPSLISYSIFFGSFSILALVFWVYQCLRNKQAANKIQDIGLEVCARITSLALDKNVINEGKELYKEIEQHEYRLVEEVKRVGSSILIYTFMFLAWLVFVMGDISEVFRYESTFIGNILIIIAMFFIMRDMTKKRR
ncbi:MAG: hypothetical protein GX088_00710 [Clostridia bacterium]|nr:hypothetical protein [Clostridia bacterium]